jgi:hypothetical protein
MIMKNFLVRFRIQVTLFTSLFFSALNVSAQSNGPIKSDTVILQVDMGILFSSGQFNPSADTVELEGTMNPDTVRMMERQGLGYIYQLTYVLPVNGYYTFKFRINSTDTVYLETADPSTRMFRVGDSTQTIFNYYNNYNPARIPMVFDCDMYYQIRSGGFSPAIDYLDVAGNFNDWGNDRIELFPRTIDSVYSFTLYFDTASIPTIPFEFKFRFNGDSATTELQGDSNRVFTMTAANHHFFCWYDNLDPNVPALPFVYNVMINDSIYSKHTVTGAYSYGDYNLRLEGESVYRWYTASTIGGALTAIENATEINYTIDSLLIGKYLVFVVTPVTIDSVVGMPDTAWSSTRIFGVGMDELKKEVAKIYPNPVHDILNVDLLQPLKVIEIMTIIGKQLFYCEITGKESVKVDLSRLDRGIYILRLIDHQNTSRIYKVVKE